ncbi:SMI1/KNR4 family protein [Paraburkholderia sp. DHOC27]|uniref:SMI1/KNR4 family protein n=1 Tax=Paraburkholderia sp. DHOC27 TaxID=2303330 RepID=UPI000E3D0215|nr:SMI1/KNR4 family protein [Paraburkholderia sp. DHOC27]RFU48311.1 SMI1/KNR4 family protein [Paraburkholderia sp. DHOC27]
MPSLHDEISDALQRGVSVRNTYFEGEPVSQLHHAATEADLQALEKTIGTKLSPTYREFFLISNGWDYVSATISLLSCAEIAEGNRKGQFDGWLSSFWDDDLGPRENALVFGRSSMTNGAYIIVLHDAIRRTSIPDEPESEFPLVYVDESTDFTYLNFLEFLRATENDYSELVQGK